MEPEPLRIAFATCEYVTEKYFYGGLAQYTHRVAKALAREGLDVHVVTLSEIDGAEFEHEGVRVHRVEGGHEPRRVDYGGRDGLSRPAERPRRAGRHARARGRTRSLRGWARRRA